MGVSLVLCFALAAFVSAAPLNQRTVVPLSNATAALASLSTTIPNAHFNVAGTIPLANAVVQSFTISEALFNNIKRYAQYSQAAYSKGNTDGNTGPVTCDNDSCPLLRETGVITVLEFENDKKSDQRGFVALDHQAKQIVLSFRGSISTRNYVYDSMLWKSGISNICRKCRVHFGFKKAWFHNRVAVVAAVEDHVAAYPDYKIVVTGHSLGGAVAFIAGAELRQRGHHVDIYTYGAPRTGNKRFVDELSSSADITARITHARDIVPKIPWMFLDYHHTSPEYWLSSGPNQSEQSEKTDYGIDDVQVCIGVDNQNCNGSTGLSVDIKAHLHYFEYLIKGSQLLHDAEAAM